MTVLAVKESQTLAQRLAEGPVPAEEALYWALTLAEALRQMHENGEAYGPLSPSNIALCGSELQLINNQEQPASIPPYVAPEVAPGHPADPRSDIFAFGAVAYEMFTGRRAFEGADAAVLSGSANGAPPPSGNAAFDRLIASCVATDPAARCPRMQKIVLELKFLLAVARRSAADLARERAIFALRSEMQQLDARVAARLRDHESTLCDLLRIPEDLVAALQNQLSAVESRIAAAQERFAVLEQGVEALSQRCATNSEQIAEIVGSRIAAVEQGLHSLLLNADGLRENIESRLRAFEDVLASKAASIEDVRAAQHQTDDLVERIVENFSDPQWRLLEEESALRSEITGRAFPTAALAETPLALGRNGESLSPAAPGQDSATAVLAAHGPTFDAAALREGFEARLRELEKMLQAKSAMIESVRAAQENTDALIERVMSYLEALQTSVLAAKTE